MHYFIKVADTDKSYRKSTIQNFGNNDYIDISGNKITINKGLDSKYHADAPYCYRDVEFITAEEYMKLNKISYMFLGNYKWILENYTKSDVTVINNIEQMYDKYIINIDGYVYQGNVIASSEIPGADKQYRYYRFKSNDDDADIPEFVLESSDKPFGKDVKSVEIF